MTKIEAENRIREAAERHGFLADRYLSTGSLYIHEADTHFLNFRIDLTEVKADFEKLEISYRVTLSGSLATMGGDPTTDELLRASEIIREGALLINEVNEANLIYTSNLRG